MLASCSNIHSPYIFQKPHTSVAKGLKEALKMNRVDATVSSYDTAWVAMVPSDSLNTKPQFPNCLNWLLENQHPDGSWAFDAAHPLLIRDSLVSTLAAVVALHKWNAAPQLVHKGLDFIVSNLWAVADKHQNSPLGFDVIFPGMIEYAALLGLNIPSSSIDHLLLNRHSHITKLGGNGLARVAEGLMGSYAVHWNEIMKYQRNNGSLFNSPSKTAAAYLQLNNEKCLGYLKSLIKEFDGAIPALYPMDIYTRLSMIDNLKKLGIDRHFDAEIHNILEDVYRCWIQGSDEIFSDAKCCALAFHLLRLNGYQVSSESLVDYERKECLLNTWNEDTKSVLELHKASQTKIFQNEPVLDRIERWTATYLQQELSMKSIQDWSLRKEVDYTLRHPYASLERIESKTYIHNFNIDNSNLLLETSYKLLGVDARDLLTFSSKDFNFCQSIHQQELQQLERWVKKYEINKLEFARQKIRYAYFAIASDIFQPHLTEARAAWAQMSVLTTVVDDFFDFAGTTEELLNLMELVERWDDYGYGAIGFKSKDVELLFNAIYGTVNEIAAKALPHQGRCIKSHLVDIWITMLKSMLMEAEWAENKTVPTLYEYLSNGYVSFALGPVVLIPLYLMGHPLSHKVIQSQEYNNLFMHMSMIGRLMNDQVSVKREGAQGKLNSVSLLSKGSMTEKEAQQHVSRMIESHRRELLRMVVDKNKSEIPKRCKDLFWTMSKVLHLFYMSDDGYSSPSKMVSAVNAVIDEPIIFPSY